MLGSVAASPLAAAIVGAILIGIGSGLCVKMGGAAAGDDALAMSLSHRFGIGIRWVYLALDLLVLALSLSYIPISKMPCSLLTVYLSGKIVGWIVDGKKTPD